MHSFAKFALSCLMLAGCFDSISNYPHNNAGRNNDDELVIVKEGKSQRNNANSEYNVANESNAFAEASSMDDLIFLEQRPLQLLRAEQQEQLAQQLLQQEQLQRQLTEAVVQQIDLLTAEEEERLPSFFTPLLSTDFGEESSAIAVAAAATLPTVAASNQAGMLHKIELRNATITTDSPAIISSANKPAPALDMSDFLELIPASKVKSIAQQYRNDAEVQRAKAFLRSQEFGALKQHIIEIPEIKAFVAYLNNSGLDLIKLNATLCNLIRNNAEVQANERGVATAGTASGNEISDIAETTQSSSEESTTPKEQLNGMQGLVDSVLDVLPQDQILATFFDKLESNELFAKLVDGISKPEFARILDNMQNSMALRHFIFTLHNNGINLTKIVDSLKSYFF